VSRFGPSVDGSLTTLAVVAAGVVALSVLALQSGPGNATPNAAGGFESTSGNVQPNATTSVGPDGKVTKVVKGKAGTTGTTGTTGNQPQGSLGGGTSATCNSSNNGGSTDRGVTATSIKLGATVVKTGIGASFLGTVSTAMQAVAEEVNQGGGICGRKLDLKLKDDAWEADRGYQFIQNLVEGDKVFALAVNPSSEGLTVASKNHYLAKTKTPVVGSDGMLNSQYTDPWIWPIAASTVSTMHIMAADACAKGKKNFAIVFDSKYKFGREGAFAFDAAVKRCTGQTIPGSFDPNAQSSCTGRFCAITAGQPSYDTENRTFNQACFPPTGQNTCDFIAFLLEPNEAVNFLRGGGLKSAVTAGLAQTLFTRDFATRCNSICDGFTVWTGYNPPIEEFGGLPAVKQYVATVRRKDPNIDVLNQFLEGGYAGMQLLVEALKRVGANVTRDRLVQALDSMNLNTGLSTPLQWRPGSHYANVAMQSFAISYKGGFNGFRNISSWVKDPNVGQDQG
jgi:ABC-type branched-subunit amino acid transport system substrate-binding protein